MKSPLLVLAAVVSGATAFAQGTITFFNNNLINPSTGLTYRAGIFRDNEPTNPSDGDLPGSPGYSTVGAGAGFSVGLFLASNPNVPLKYVNGQDAVTTFRTTTAPEVFATAGDVIVPGVLPGTSANLLVRAWTTAAGGYNNPVGLTFWERGEAAFTSKPLGGTNPNPPPPSFFTADMAPFTGFEMDTVPEPSSIALSILGIRALLLRRRK